MNFLPRLIIINSLFLSVQYSFPSGSGTAPTTGTQGQTNDVTNLTLIQEKLNLSLFPHPSPGRPAPKVTWWHDNLEIASQSHPSADKAAPAIVNQLFIGTVTREFLGTRLQCRAQGSKLVPAVVKEVTVQVHCTFISFSRCSFSLTLLNRRLVLQFAVFSRDFPEPG